MRCLVHLWGVENLPAKSCGLGFPSAFLPGRECAPGRRRPSKPRLGSPAAQWPPPPSQPGSPARPGGHPRGRGSPARGRGRRAIGLRAARRGGTSAGRQTRLSPAAHPSRAQSSPAVPRPCPARAAPWEGPPDASSAPAGARKRKFSFPAPRVPFPPPARACAAQRGPCDCLGRWGPRGSPLPHPPPP